MPELNGLSDVIVASGKKSKNGEKCYLVWKKSDAFHSIIKSIRSAGGSAEKTVELALTFLATYKPVIDELIANGTLDAPENDSE